MATFSVSYTEILNIWHVNPPWQILNFLDVKAIVDNKEEEEYNEELCES